MKHEEGLAVSYSVEAEGIMERANPLFTRGSPDHAGRLGRVIDMTLAERDKRIAELETRKDAAYEERNRVVALLAALAMDMGWLVFRTKTAIAGWSEDWHGCVYIETPQGQVSWHYHDSHSHLFTHLPERASWEWDGHDTSTKYARVAALCR